MPKECKAVKLFELLEKEVLTVADISHKLSLTEDYCQKVVRGLIEEGIIKRRKVYNPSKKQSRPTYEYYIERCEEVE